MLRLLTCDEYHATFVEPMRRLGDDESYKPISLGDYVRAALNSLDLKVSFDDLQIHHVYLNGNQSFYHVLLNYGRKNEYMVVVVDCELQVVHGHYLLDLKSEYGDGSPGEP